jgi:hypothetical protein
MDIKSAKMGKIIIHFIFRILNLQCKTTIFPPSTIPEQFYEMADEMSYWKLKLSENGKKLTD